MFKYFDNSFNKFLSKSDWLKGIKQLGITNFSNNILLELFDDYDIKRDGRLDFEEFGEIFSNNNFTNNINKNLASNRYEEKKNIFETSRRTQTNKNE
jgi:Ca2+-binding EF-hand superfamily protein